MADLRIKIRGDTGAAWLAANPILALDELVWDRTARSFKIGDGVTAWASLPDVRLAPPVITETDGSVSLRTDNLLHKLTLRSSAVPPIIELDGASILYDMQDLQDIIDQVETDVAGIGVIKTAVDTAYADILTQKALSDTAKDNAETAIATVTGLVGTTQAKVDAADASATAAATSAAATLTASAEAAGTLVAIRTIAAQSTFLSSTAIASGEFDVVTKIRKLARAEINKSIFITGITGAKLVIPPNLILASDAGAGVFELHNVGTTDISIEPEGTSTGPATPRYIQKWVGGKANLLASITADITPTDTIVMTVPAVAAGGMMLFFVCVNTKFYSGSSAVDVTGRWSAGLTGALTKRITTPLPSQKSGAAHLFSFEYKLADNFPGGTLTAEFTFNKNPTSWDITGVLIDNIDVMDFTPASAGTNVATTPNHTLTQVTTGQNVIMFNFASRVYVDGSPPTSQCAFPIHTVWSDVFSPFANETYNAHVDMLGYDLFTTAAASKTYNPNMGKNIQCQNSIVGYRGTTGGSLPTAIFKPATAITLQPEKMIQVYTLPSEPTVYHIR